jgi:hypothetical protein
VSGIRADVPDECFLQVRNVDCGWRTFASVRIQLRRSIVGDSISATVIPYLSELSSSYSRIRRGDLYCGVKRSTHFPKQSATYYWLLHVPSPICTIYTLLHAPLIVARTGMFRSNPQHITGFYMCRAHYVLSIHYYMLRSLSPGTGMYCWLLSVWEIPSIILLEPHLLTEYIPPSLLFVSHCVFTACFSSSPTSLLALPCQSSSGANSGRYSALDRPSRWSLE